MVFLRDNTGKNKGNFVKSIYFQEFDDFLHHPSFYRFFYRRGGRCQDATQHSHGSLRYNSAQGERKSLFVQTTLRSFQIILFFSE